MRLLTAEIDIFRCEPHLELMSERSRNEAYCTAIPGEAYTVFFPDGGNVALDVSAARGHARRLTVRWLDIRNSRWVDDLPPWPIVDQQARRWLAAGGRCSASPAWVTST